MALNALTPEFAAFLAAHLPEGTIREAEPRHLADPRGRWTGQAGPVALPRSVEEVASIVAACASASVGIVPWGGGTGLVGGQLMANGPLPLVLSLERMNRVRDIFPEENMLVAEAGCTLQQVQDAAAAAGRLFPLTLASQGSCTIGGNLATNAGGVNVIRYGNARSLCLGLEAVLADGTIWRGLTRLRKDNAGYDLRDLLIGAEGTLGVITAAALILHPRPAQNAAALIAVPHPTAALTLLSIAQEQLPGMVSAFELISGMSLQFLAETLPEVRQPFAEPSPWLVLVDLGLPERLEAEQALIRLYETGAAKGLALDAILAQNETQRAQFWTLRENIPTANRRIGAVSSHDISLPLSEIPAFIPAAQKALGDIAPFRVNCFGHLGDGNLHFNVFPPKGGHKDDHADQREAVKRLVHDMVASLGGSVAAEHGVGRFKTADITRYADPGKLAAMRAVKAALDPAGILNPGAVLAG
ncbi:FAD-binding oxidoreductase [Neogemmobacter tilapiae]|uniref:D-2-hydroxyacid dehydrogenase n=1 Tax=Neogemmobacter tilapiae TaxID=875041 RepID=A0A918WGK0_9RHOB|nr:FAD-binding oxidoreductase [Gemmobacter tilapiae]GHC44645.1 D-2-hydroxyacid dehydrogenase [Gemmobacter tilapiae]